MWWIELAILAVALVNIPILRWCHARWSKQEQEDDMTEPAVNS